MKRSRISFVVSGVALSLVLFASCGDKSNPTSAAGGLAGTWNLTSVTASGQTFAAGTSTITQTATLNTNGTYSTTSTVYFVPPPVTETETGTWTSTSTKLITVKTGTTVSDTIPFVLSGSTLTLSETDSTSGAPMTMVFARQ